MEDQTPRCQSCGMPLSSPDILGTNQDGSPNSEYCRFCWQAGRFTEPDITMEKMIANTVVYMEKGLHMNHQQAEEIASLLVPRLNRWQEVPSRS
ncbi:MAG TPA: zinc ribbon domain-containing protein [Patescibacteria group bacterium]|nr:zinc ribbon domain-containing protein [Patescibacteria group bacterium]